METMRVDLINLGNGPRVFYDRRNLPVLVGIGKIVAADMGDEVLKSLRAPGETVMVAGAGEGKIPQPVQEVVNLLAVLAFEEYDTLLRRFLAIVPTNDSTKIRPHRQQMRVALTNYVEDFVRHAARKEVRDDVDPAQLEREQAEEKARQTPPPPVHEPAPPPPPQHALKVAQAARQPVAAPATAPVPARAPARTKTARNKSRR